MSFHTFICNRCEISIGLYYKRLHEDEVMNREGKMGQRTNLQRRNVVGSNEHHPCKFDIMVIAQNALDKQIRLTAVIDEPGEIAGICGINAKRHTF